MFTGLVEELGRVSAVDKRSAGVRLQISAHNVTADLADGDSIAVNGVCLTALDVTPTSFAADVSPETVHRTTIGNFDTGTRVNLERSVTPLTHLGGHYVQGHVDGRGTFLSAVEEGEFRTVRIGFPPEIAKYFVYKGSVAVDGISLTIAALGDDDLDIAVIPKTWELTDLSSLKPGDALNLEVDIIAKYVERMLQFRES
jgi:riboflavin synthase